MNVNLDSQCGRIVQSHQGHTFQLQAIDDGGKFGFNVMPEHHGMRGEKCGQAVGDALLGHGRVGYHCKPIARHSTSKSDGTVRVRKMARRRSLAGF